MGGGHSKEDPDWGDEGHSNEGDNNKHRQDKDKDKRRDKKEKQREQESGQDIMEHSSLEENGDDDVEVIRNKFDQAEDGDTKPDAATAVAYDQKESSANAGDRDVEVDSTAAGSAETPEDGRVADKEAGAGEENIDAPEVSKVTGLLDRPDIGADKTDHADAMELPKVPVLSHGGDTADISGLELEPDQDNELQVEAEGELVLHT